MQKISANVERFLKTWSGKKLLEKHKLDDNGVWHIFGEDPNCDLGGSHHEPDLGIVKGRLGDVIKHAVEMRGFWQWGAGGRIEHVKITNVNATTKRKRQRLEKLKKQVRDLEAEIGDT